MSSASVTPICMYSCAFALAALLFTVSARDAPGWPLFPRSTVEGGVAGYPQPDSQYWSSPFLEAQQGVDIVQRQPGYQFKYGHAQGKFQSPTPQVAFAKPRLIRGEDQNRDSGVADGEAWPRTDDDAFPNRDGAPEPSSALPQDENNNNPHRDSFVSPMASPRFGAPGKPKYVPVGGSVPAGPVWVGSPPTKIDIIFDTGSNALVVKGWEGVQKQMERLEGDISKYVEPRVGALYVQSASKTYVQRKTAQNEPLQNVITYGSGSALLQEGLDDVSWCGMSLSRMPVSGILWDNLNMLHAQNATAGILGLQHMKNATAGSSLFSKAWEEEVMHAFGYCRNGVANNGTWIWEDPSLEGHEMPVKGSIHWAVGVSAINTVGPSGRQRPVSTGRPNGDHARKKPKRRQEIVHSMDGNQPQDGHVHKKHRHHTVLSGNSPRKARQIGGRKSVRVHARSHHGKYIPRGSGWAEAEADNDNDDDDGLAYARGEADDVGTDGDGLPRAQDADDDAEDRHDVPDLEGSDNLESGEPLPEEGGVRKKMVSAKNRKRKRGGVKKAAADSAGNGEWTDHDEPTGNSDSDGWENAAGNRADPGRGTPDLDDVAKRVRDIIGDLDPTDDFWIVDKFLEHYPLLKEQGDSQFDVDTFPAALDWDRIIQHMLKRKDDGAVLMEQAEKNENPLDFCKENADCVGILDSGSNIISGPASKVKEINAYINMSRDCSNLATLPKITMKLGGGEVNTTKLVQGASFADARPFFIQSKKYEPLEVVITPDMYTMKILMPRGMMPMMRAMREHQSQNLTASFLQGRANVDSRLDPFAIFVEHVRRKYGFHIGSGIDLFSGPVDPLDTIANMFKPVQVCVSAFIPLSAKTQLGELWIVGTPLQSGYYTRWSRLPNSDPTIFVQKMPCETCKKAHEKGQQLLEKQVAGTERGVEQNSTADCVSPEAQEEKGQDQKKEQDGDVKVFGRDTHESRNRHSTTRDRSEESQSAAFDPDPGSQGSMVEETAESWASIATASAKIAASLPTLSIQEIIFPHWGVGLTEI